MNNVNFILELADFLESASSPFADPLKSGDILWTHYSEIHSPTQNPLGCIAITSVKPNDFNTNYPVNIYQFQLRLLVSESTIADQLNSLQIWRNRLADDILSTLKIDGYNGWFQGIQVTSSSVHPVINQDKGGTGAVIIYCQWNTEAKDYGFIPF